MRLKEEHEPASNTRSFIDTFKAYRDRVSYDRFIWRGTTVPALGQVRGKIVILDEFSGGVYGIRWGSLNIQDAYTEYDTAAKWNLVREHFARTDAGAPASCMSISRVPPAPTCGITSSMHAIPGRWPRG